MMTGEQGWPVPQVKQCVYCGGDEHPGECGQPYDDRDELDSARGVVLGLAVALGASAVAFLLIWLVVATS